MLPRGIAHIAINFHPHRSSTALAVHQFAQDMMNVRPPAIPNPVSRMAELTEIYSHKQGWRVPVALPRSGTCKEELFISCSVAVSPLLADLDKQDTTIG